MRQIKAEVLQRIKDDENLILEVAHHLGRRFRTVYQWVLDNGEQLQTPAVLEIIRKKFGFLDASKMLEEKKKARA